MFVLYDQNVSREVLKYYASIVIKKLGYAKEVGKGTDS